MSRNVQLTTGFMAGLIAVAVMAPGAPLHRRKHDIGRRVKPVPPGADAPSALVTQGHALFVTNCSPCHGADAEGDDGPNLHHKNLPNTFIVTAVKSGFKDEMPPFGSKLKPLEVKALVAYVHSLQK